MILAILAVVTATIQPASPAVGDLITIQFSQPVKIEASPDYEIVSQNGKRAVVRTFAPRPFVLRGVNIRVPVKSVLAPKDDMKPAPLAAPRAVPYPREPFVAIAIAALCAIAAWTFVVLRSRKREEVVVPAMSAEERFRRAVLALRATSKAQRWTALADETRAYLAATRPGLGKELTTSELLPRLADEERIVNEILRQGDLEKFSPWGAREESFEEIAEGALGLVRVGEVER
jgi:hypothetical protein